MFRHRAELFAGVFTVMAMATTLAFSAGAGPRRDADGSKSEVSTTLNVLDQMTLGGQTVKPGTYIVRANDTTVIFEQNGKTVAQAPVEWKNSTDKPRSSNLLADSGSIKEIHFGGKTKYVVISE